VQVAASPGSVEQSVLKNSYTEILVDHAQRRGFSSSSISPVTTSLFSSEMDSPMSQQVIPADAKKAVPLNQGLGYFTRIDCFQKKPHRAFSFMTPYRIVPITRVTFEVSVRLAVQPEIIPE